MIVLSETTKVREKGESMYCPRCASHLADTLGRCPECGLDVQAIAHVLHQQEHAEDRDSESRVVARSGRWKSQRHALGLLLIMCSLLVGCFIPICIGLFGSYAGLGSLLLVMAGSAGILLLLGAMLILASEGVLLTSTPPQGNWERTLARPSAQSRSLPQLLVPDINVPITSRDQTLYR
jgi:hypothetical protein